MNKKTVNISKYLSFILRHKPDEIGLTLDENGWASLDELIEKSWKNGKPMDPDTIRLVVETNDKQRFSISDCGTKIRANQGHSIKIDLGLEPLTPPEILFHGTATRFMNSIREKGLIKQNRHHVHLSASETIAKLVGSRHGKPVVLKVPARQMHDHGFVFFCSANGVWLVDRVPVKYISDKE